MIITLTESENDTFLELLRDLSARYGSAEGPEFLAQATVHAHQLPFRLRQTLNEFRLFEPEAAICRIRGTPSMTEIGPTPAALEGPAEKLYSR